MKCLISTKNTQIAIRGDVIRVTEETAIELIASGGWKYCAKHFWKAQQSDRQ